MIFYVQNNACYNLFIFYTVKSPFYSQQKYIHTKKLFYSVSPKDGNRPVRVGTNSSLLSILLPAKRQVPKISKHLKKENAELLRALLINILTNTLLNCGRKPTPTQREHTNSATNCSMSIPETTSENVLHLILHLR